MNAPLIPDNFKCWKVLPSPPQVGALKRLQAALSEARDIYDDRDKTPDGESGPIAGVVCAVHEIHRYLSAAGIPGPELKSLLVLEAAFRDHARGKPHPLFDVTRKRGKRAYSADNVWQAYVAVAAQLLVDAGETKENAQAIVAERIGREPKTVGTWHREISTCRKPDKATWRIFSETRDMVRALPEDDWYSAALELVESLPEIRFLPTEEL